MELCRRTAAAVRKNCRSFWLSVVVLLQVCLRQSYLLCTVVRFYRFRVGLLLGIGMKVIFGRELYREAEKRYISEAYGKRLLCKVRKYFTHVYHIPVVIKQSCRYGTKWV